MVGQIYPWLKRRVCPVEIREDPIQPHPPGQPLSCGCVQRWEESSRRETIGNTWKRWWVSLPRLGYQRLTSTLPSFSLWFFSLAALVKLLCCELPYGESHVPRNWRWPSAKSQQRINSVQWAASNPTLPTTPSGTWRYILPRSSLQMTATRPTPCLEPESGPSSGIPRIWTHGNCKNKCFCFKPLSFRMICDAETGWLTPVP